MRRRLLLGGSMLGIIVAIGTVALMLGLLPRSPELGHAQTIAATSTMNSGITVQNLSSATANLVIDFYDQSGNLITGASVSTSIAPNSSWTRVTANIPNLPAGFMGSAVVSSDQPVAAIVNTQNTGAGTSSDPIRVGTSLGVDAPSVKSYAPQVMKGFYGWNSSIYAQNTTSASAVVTVTIVGSDGLVKSVRTATIPPNAMKEFKQADDTALGGSFVGSAVIESVATVAAVVNFFNDGLAYSTAQYHSYNTISAGGTKLYVPRLVRKFYDYNSGLKVQNIGTEATNVTVTYYIGSSNGVTQTALIQPNQSWGPYMATDGQLPAGLSNGTGSAIIESSGSQPIVAIVNEDNRVLGRGVTYNAIPDGNQTTTIFFPQVTSRFYGYSSGIQFQNVGTITATGTLTLRASGADPIVIPFDLGSNKSLSFFAPSASGNQLKDFNGSAVVQTSNGQSIVGIANLSFRGDIDPRFGDKLGDSFTTYNGLNRN